MIKEIEEECKKICYCECCNECISEWMVVYSKGVCKIFSHLCGSCKEMNEKDGFVGDEYIKNV